MAIFAETLAHRSNRRSRGINFSRRKEAASDDRGDRSIRHEIEVLQCGSMRQKGRPAEGRRRCTNSPVNRYNLSLVHAFRFVYAVTGRPLKRRHYDGRSTHVNTGDLLYNRRLRNAIPHSFLPSWPSIHRQNRVIRELPVAGERERESRSLIHR